MTTLIAIYNVDGFVGQCDARCYNAKQPNCDCICQGKNHGVGIHAAAQNTLRETAAWLEQQNPDGIADREITAKVARQLRQLAAQAFLPFDTKNDEPDYNA